MYRCEICGHLFEEGEEKTYIDPSTSEEWKVCPICKGDYEESVKCAMCGENFFESDLHNDLCNDCLEEVKKYQTDVDFCFEVGKKDTQKVEINVFLASMFDEKEIEEILYKALKDAEKYVGNDVSKKCIQFAMEDREWFVENAVDIMREKK